MATTLEILAPFLPYGIEVEYHGGGTRHLLNGLNFDGRQTWFAATKSFNGWIEFGFGNLLPVLRPFSQLCDPLPDGTVPAVELARRFLFGEITEAKAVHGVGPASNGARLSPYRPAAEVGDGPSQSEGILIAGWLKNGLRNEKFTVAVGQDGILSNGYHSFNISDWLRANHYALPVNGRPLIEGVDYIAKSAGSPTIEKEKKS